MLDEEGIVYRIAEGDAGQYLRIVHGSSFFGRMIFVDKQDYERAKMVVASIKMQTPDDETDETAGSSIGRKIGKGIIWWYVGLTVVGFVGLLVVAIMALVGAL